MKVWVHIKHYGLKENRREVKAVYFDEKEANAAFELLGGKLIESEVVSVRTK